jgi:hypothetical protein
VAVRQSQPLSLFLVFPITIAPIPNRLTIESALPRDAVEKIIALREARKVAISHHEYERARQLEEEIAEVKAQATRDAIEAIRDNFRTSAIAYLNRFSENYQRLLDDAAQKENNARVSYHKTFEALQANHKTKLLACEKDLEETRAREAFRRVPAAEQQLELSEKAAATSQYEEAIRLRDASRTIMEKDVIDRLAEVNQKFEIDRDNLYALFGRELEVLSDRFVADLEKAALAKEDVNRDDHLSGMLQKAQGKIAKVIDASAKEQLREKAKLLEGDLYAIVSERGYPMPAVASAPRLGTEKKPPISRSKRSSRTSASE